MQRRQELLATWHLAHRNSAIRLYLSLAAVPT
jgi:hypothetical protein